MTRARVGESGPTERHRRIRPTRTVAIAAALVLALVASVLVFRSGSNTTNPTAVRSVVDRLAHGTWVRREPVPDRGFGAVTTLWTGRELLTFGHSSTDDRWHGFSYVNGRGWRRLSPPPTSVASQRTIWTGREVLVWNGGYAYNPRSNRWRVMAPIPIDTGMLPTNTWTGRALIVTSAAGAVSYNPASDRWSMLQAPPVDLGSSRGEAAWDGKKVVFLLSTAPVRRALGFDPATGVWSDLPVPIATANPTTADLVGRRGSVVEVAWFGTQPDGLMHAMSLGGGALAWTRLASRSQPYLCDPLATVVRAGLVVQCAGRSFEALDTSSNQWREVAAPPIGIHGQIAWNGSEILAVAGRQFLALVPAGP